MRLRSSSSAARRAAPRARAQLPGRPLPPTLRRWKVRGGVSSAVGGCDDGEGATAPPRRSEKNAGGCRRGARARGDAHEHIVSPEGGDAEVEVVLELGGALGHEVGDVGGVDVAKVLLVVGEEGRDVSVHEGLAGGLGPRLDGVGRVLHLLALSPAHPGVDQRLLRRLRIRVGLRQGFRRARSSRCPSRSTPSPARSGDRGRTPSGAPALRKASHPSPPPPPTWSRPSAGVP